jgi:hypothetical protein
MTQRILLSILTLVVICCVGMGLLTAAGGAAVANASNGAPVQPTAMPLPTLQAIPTSALDQNLPSEVVQQMNAIQDQVIQIRGLQPNKTLERALLTNDQLQLRVKDDFFKDYSASQAADDVLELSLLGLVEPGFDLYNLYIKLYSEQVAGFYDSKTKEMFVVQGENFQGTERMNYAHEYTHALQDQNYDLRQGLKVNEDYCKKNAEYCSAVQALFEGDATAVQQEWLATDSTQTDRTEIQNFYSHYKSPVFDSAPAYLKKSFLFPYQQGLEFVMTQLDKGGYAAVDAAFKNPPVSTEQILHPDLYPNDVPDQVSVPDLLPALGSGWRETDRNMLGEMSDYLVLSQGERANYRLPDGQARKAAAGWGGDMLAVYSQDSTQEKAMAYRSRWDTSKDADEFWQALQDYSQARWGSPSRSQAGQQVWDQTTNGSVLIKRAGQEVLWIITPNPATTDQVLNSFTDFK